MLRTHEECHQKAYLKRSGARNPATDIRGYFPGTVVDRVMREWLDNHERAPGGMAARVPEILEREEVVARETGDGIVRWKGQNDKLQVIRDCIECVTRLEPILNRLVLPHEFEPAKRFSVPLTVPGPYEEPVTIVLNGEMDLLTREAGANWCVYDLKMTRDEGYWRKTVMQLVFYDLAVRAGFGKYSSRLALIQPMCKQQLVFLDTAELESLRNQMVARIISMIHDRVIGYVEPKATTENCAYCEVRHACIRFRPVGGRMRLLTA